MKKTSIIIYCFLLLSCAHNNKKGSSELITYGEKDKRFGVLLNLEYSIDTFTVNRELKINNGITDVHLDIIKIPVQDISLEYNWYEEKAFNVMIDFYDNYEDVIPHSDRLCLDAKNYHSCFSTSGIQLYHKHKTEIIAFFDKLKTKKFDDNESENPLYSDIPIEQREQLIQILKTDKRFNENQTFNIVHCTDEEFNQLKTLSYHANVVKEDTLFGSLNFVFLNDLDNLKLLGFSFKKNDQNY
jgi:hypothetical protein